LYWAAHRPIGRERDRLLLFAPLRLLARLARRRLLGHLDHLDGLSQIHASSPSTDLAGAPTAAN
jgi:hypothetical protein